MARSKVSKCGARPKSVERITYDVPEAGAMIGLSRGGAYEAARNGEIPTVPVGRRLLVPRGPFHAKFGDVLKS